MVRFGKNGTDATTAAVRLARAFTGRDTVLICGGYHGWNDWSIAGTERDRGVPGAMKELVTRVPFGEMVTNWRAPVDFAAIIVEPQAKPEYLSALRAYCDATGAVLIFDEVITGFRYALGGAQELYDVYPDLACFGKAMANGMPLSAIVGRAEIMRLMEPPNPCVFVSGTFGGEALSLAAALATIDKLERENVIATLWATGNRLLQGVKQIHDTHGIGDAIRYGGEPPLVRLQFRDQQVADVFRREMIASGTLIIASHNVCFAHDENAVHRILKSYEHTFSVLAKQ
jgi:glutamate-1-semialdehyde aminotransferase